MRQFANADIPLPNRAVPLADTADPIEPASRTDRVPPARLFEAAETELDILTDAPTDREEPIWTASKMEARPPEAALLSTLKLLPPLKYARIDNELPILHTPKIEVSV